VKMKIISFFPGRCCFKFALMGHFELNYLDNCDSMPKTSLCIYIILPFVFFIKLAT
jgi:hypothetical protein